eukprot:11165610-Alexandrium_andersonii.AAC.1
MGHKGCRQPPGGRGSSSGAEGGQLRSPFPRRRHGMTGRAGCGARAGPGGPVGNGRMTRVGGAIGVVPVGAAQ